MLFDCDDGDVACLGELIHGSFRRSVSHFLALESGEIQLKRLLGPRHSVKTENVMNLGHYL